MTTQLDAREVAKAIEQVVPGSVDQVTSAYVLVKADHLAEVARFLRDDPALKMHQLVDLSGVDYIDYFEVVYHLLSMEKNHAVTLKARSYSREYPAVPSVTPVWQGADLQERETYDLLGIVFSGHPNLKRLMLWEGFQGHPQRRDFKMRHYEVLV